jgi:hypothetical protein
MLRKTGTKLLAIPKQKQPLSRISLIPLQTRGMQSSLMCGAIFIPQTDIIPTSHIDLTAGQRDLDGGWICVSSTIAART